MMTVNAFILILLPLVFVAAYILIKDRQAFQRLRPFRTVRPKEAIQVNYAVHQIARVLLIFGPLFLRIENIGLREFFGGIIYLLGLILLYFSLAAQVETAAGDFVRTGIYRRSRQPLFISQCLIFLGVGGLMDALPYFFVLLAFIASRHPLILEEEAAHAAHYGEDYLAYMQEVRRYF